jgi:GMC oxidoreductase
MFVRTSKQLPPVHVCIIGAGAAGITLALELDGAPFSVAVLTGSEDYGGDSLGSHPPPSHFRRIGYGGTTAIWGGRVVPFDPIDFEQREYVSDSGWPISYDDVARHYPRAMDYVEAGDNDFTVSGTLSPGDTITGFEGNDLINTDRIERYSPPTRFGKRYKATLEKSRNVYVLSKAHCIRLHTTPEGRISTAETVEADGTRSFINATIFVVATGGLETTRLLTISDPNGKGLGNESGALGRYYTCHVESFLATLRTRNGAQVIYDFEKTKGIYCRRKFQIKAAAQRKYHLPNATFRLHYPVLADARHASAVLSAVYIAKKTLIPEYRRILIPESAYATVGDTSLLKHWTNVFAGMPELAQFSAEWLMKRILPYRKLPYVLVEPANGVYRVEFNFEQIPSPASRVYLGDKRDRFGIPQLVIDWRITEADIEMISRTYRMVRDSLKGTSCEIEFDDLLEENLNAVTPVGGHHLGTARMALNPKNGVVDTNCRVLGWDNLFVCGSATFPTSSHANPTVTIVALSIRMAEHLKKLNR